MRDRPPAKNDATAALSLPSPDGASLRSTSGLTVAMASGAQFAVGVNSAASAAEASASGPRAHAVPF